MVFANHINTVIKLIVSLWFIDCFSRIYLLALALSILVRIRNWLKPIVVRIENDRNVIEMIYFDAFRWRYTCLLAGSFVWSAFACKLRTQLNRFIEIIIIFVQFYCSMFADYSSFGHIQLFKYEYFTCFKFTNELNFCFSSWNWRKCPWLPPRLGMVLTPMRESHFTRHSLWHKHTICTQQNPCHDRCAKEFHGISGIVCDTFCTNSPPPITFISNHLSRSNKP